MRIAIKDLEELGWKFDYFYAPGQENMYTKNGRSLRVGNYKPSVFDRNTLETISAHEDLTEASYLLTYSGYPTRQIESLNDLESYELTGK